MRNALALMLMSVLAVACNGERDHGPALQPDAPTVGYRDDAASAVARPQPSTSAVDAGDPAPIAPVPAPAPVPAQPDAPPAPTGTVAVEPAPTMNPPPAGQGLVVPRGPPNLVLLSSAAGPRPTELSHPEGAPNAAEPRADLKARVVLDAGVMRYELYATAPAPWVVKSTTPFNLTLRPSNGVRLNKTIFTRNDFANPDLAVKQINAEIDASPGEHAIDATAELYVCSADLCKRVNEKMHTEFTIPRT